MENNLTLKRTNREITFDADDLLSTGEIEVRTTYAYEYAITWLNLEQVQQLHAFLGEQLSKVK